MTPEERDALRALQDRWLALPCIRRMVEQHGEDEPVAMGWPGKPWPTFGDVRELLLPELKEWFEDLFREGP